MDDAYDALASDLTCDLGAAALSGLPIRYEICRILIYRINMTSCVYHPAIA